MVFFERKIGGKRCICAEVQPGLMRFELSGSFGAGIDRHTVMLIPSDLSCGNMDFISDLWLTEQEKELGLPEGMSCNSNSWQAGSADDSLDSEVTHEYDRLIQIALS